MLGAAAISRSIETNRPWVRGASVYRGIKSKFCMPFFSVVLNGKLVAGVDLLTCPKYPAALCLTTPVFEKYPVHPPPRQSPHSHQSPLRQESRSPTEGYRHLSA